MAENNTGATSQAKADGAGDEYIKLKVVGQDNSEVHFKVLYPILSFTDDSTFILKIARKYRLNIRQTWAN